MWERERERERGRERDLKGLLRQELARGICRTGNPGMQLGARRRRHHSQRLWQRRVPSGVSERHPFPQHIAHAFVRRENDRLACSAAPSVSCTEV